MNEKDFIAYEYQTKTVKAKDQTRVMDMSEAFGWEVTGTTPTIAEGVTISLKRDRKIRHKQELVKLERQAEETYAAICKLKSAKTLAASVFAYIFGCIAALVFGGGMCMTMLIENNPAAFAGGIILGIVGIVLCSVNYLIYKKIEEKKTVQVLPMIDDNEEKLANVLAKGNDLLNADLI
ncbi:MAG: hypothetical protein K2O89_07435 [Clostridia bacterium]|nr:hypothetical protein [Clostridia bacterium]